MTIPAEIEAVALLGWKVFPCSRTSRAACFKGAKDRATDDLDQLAAWSREYSRSNWRVICGPSGIWAMDLDLPGPDHAADGIAAMARMVATHGALPKHPRTRSGGGGLALFFRHTGEPIQGKTGTPDYGMDPRRGALTVEIPPSIHIRTRRPYRWLTPPWEVTPPTAPGWLLRAVAPPPEPERPASPAIPTTDSARRLLIRAVDRVASAGDGTRNDTLNRQSYGVARFVAAGLLAETEAIDALYAAARQAGLDHLEIKNTIRSAFASGFRRPIERGEHGRYAAA